ncbi:MAG: 3'-5' exonuclease [Candidatus Electrothrix sp. GW3-4]|uniref:3'-5' exonuclease n=1 Tax=Candidatus Electrothrix sp. GW3-4 TaxID=3126740 RepID=UPI0030D58D1B
MLSLDPPHPVLRRNKEQFLHFNQGAPLTDYSFVVCDTELTGLNKRKDEIISIGAVRIVNLQIELDQTFHRYIRPVHINPNEATLIHRITPEELKRADSAAEVLPDFIEFCDNSLIVGHFVGLDMSFLNKAARQLLGGTLSNPGIDTMRLARRYKDSGKIDHYGHHDHASSYTLDALTKEFGLPLFKPHDALEDALQTAYLFLYLVKKIRDGGIHSLKELYRAGRIRG